MVAAITAGVQPHRNPSPAARLLIALIRLYQSTLSRLLGPACRFEPSCSRYAAACLVDHGALRGGLLSIVRLCKCHPFHPGGYDPPPTRILESERANVHVERELANEQERDLAEDRPKAH